MKERLTYIDQMRGIAILLVIMGHLIQFNGLGLNNAVFEFIYSFHMPLFFIISGYIGFKTVKVNGLKSYILLLKKKFIGLMLPLLFWSLIVTKYFFTDHWTVISIDDLASVFYRPNLWFLSTLFYIFVFYGLFYWITSKFNKKNHFYIDAVFVCLFIGASILLDYLHILSSFGLYTIFFYFGTLISKYSKIENLIMNLLVFTSCILLFLILVCHWSLGENTLDDFYKLLISALSFVILMNICRRIVWNPVISKQVTNFGIYSLCIYVEQFHVTKLLVNNVSLVEMNPFILFIFSAVISIILGYICIGFAKIIELSPILDFLMFGKNKI
jgi:fucose 4-O-acetylase-like acetyltransferase